MKQSELDAILSRNRQLTISDPARAQVPDAQPAQQAGALERDDAGEAQGAGRPRLCITLRRVKLLDWDAKYGSIKDVLDGLTHAELLPGDREDQIDEESRVRQEKVAHYAQEETEIIITYPPS